MKKRGLASGLATAGLGVGMGLSGLLGQSLISAFGFRWAYAIFGIIALVWIFAPRKVRLVEGRALARARKGAPTATVASRERSQKTAGVSRES